MSHDLKRRLGLTRMEVEPVWLLGALPGRWPRMAQTIVIVVVGVTDLQHHRSPGIVAVLWLYMVFGVAMQGTRDQAECAVRDRRFLRSWMAWAHTVCLLGLLGTSIALAFLLSGAVGPIGLFVAVLTTFRLIPLAGTVLLALLGAILVGWSEAIGRGTPVDGAQSSFLFLGAFVIVTLIIWARMGNEQAVRMEKRAVALGERQRLAREMHDVLAHSLSGLVLQLEGARMLAKENPSDPRLLELIERAHHLGKSGLTEAKRAIGTLRDDDLPGPEQLGTLVEQFQRDSGIPCQLAVSGPAHDLDSEARLAIYRVAQEALTNIRKHAHPRRVDVTLVYAADHTNLTVEDFGANGAKPAGGAKPADSVPTGGLPAGGAPSAIKNSGGGYGLTGMRERAELVGGSLTAVPTSTGFRVELQVPA